MPCVWCLVNIFRAGNAIFGVNPRRTTVAPVILALKPVFFGKDTGNFQPWRQHCERRPMVIFGVPSGLARGGVQLKFIFPGIIL
jgi:hypothetical protein